MTAPEHAEIRRALRQFHDLADLNAHFLQHCSKHGVPEGLDVRLDVVDTSLQVNCFGQVALAKARYVLIKRGLFVAEYVFHIAHDDTAVEVWRFYLTPHLSPNRFAAGSSSGRFIPAF
jgi:hypothetical protein